MSHLPNRTLLCRLTFLCLFLVLLRLPNISAQNRWVNPAGGSYANGANWSSGTPPILEQDAEFDLDGSYQVNWDAAVGNTSNNDIDVTAGDVSFQSFGDTFTHQVTRNASIESASLTIGRAGGNPMRMILGTTDPGPASLSVGGSFTTNTPSILNITHGSSIQATRNVFVTGNQFDAADAETTLNITSGGLLDAQEQMSVRGSDAAANVNVSGAGSKLTVARSLQITSFTGQSHLNITNKGTVDVSDTLFLGSSRLGSDSPVSINVSGDGSKLSVIATEPFADSGSTEIFNGNLKVGAGASVDVDGFTFIGIGPEKQAVATIVGPESRLSSETVYVGDSGGDGTLHILDGAVVESTLGRIGSRAHQPTFASHGGAKGAAVVDGRGSWWQNSGSFIVGMTDADGQLTVSNGGVVTATRSSIGLGEGTTGDVVVAGAGSLIDLTEGLVIGTNGRGSLTIRDGGRVNIGTTARIHSSSQVDLANGTLNVDGAIENLGQIRVKEDSFVHGHLTMVGDESSLDVLSGQTTLNGDVHYDDGTIRIDDGAILKITGNASGASSYEGIGTIVFDGTLDPGNSAAAVGFEGNVEIGDSTNVRIELGGTNAGSFDQLLIDGEFKIDGNLDVTLIDDFELSFGQTFLIADVELGQSGQFAGLGEGALVNTYDGIDLFITYEGFDGNHGVGLFTAVVPEPVTTFALVSILPAIIVRRRR